MELCYTNNPKSLFRKYAKLLTIFARTQLGRDFISHNSLKIPQKIGLLLPNGFHEFDGKQGRLTVTTRAIYAPKLYSALFALDTVNQWIKDFDEAKELLAWYLGLRHKPLFASQAFNTLFTTTNFYPDAHTETTTVDGMMARESVTEAWATIRAGAGTAAFDAETVSNVPVRISTLGRTSPNYESIWRSAFLFDTSSLTANATISVATFSLYGVSKVTLNDLGGLTVRLVQSSPASNTALATSDYNIGSWPATTAQSDTEINNRDWNDAGYNDYALNATGLGNVSKTSITKLGMMFTNDATNTEPSYTAGNDCRVGGGYADAGSNKPKLVVDFTLPAAGGNDWPVMKGGKFWGWRYSG